jgi:hypothetical protein
MINPLIGSEATRWLRKLKDAAYAKSQAPEVPSKAAKELCKSGCAEGPSHKALRITEFGYQYLRMLDKSDCT